MFSRFSYSKLTILLVSFISVIMSLFLITGTSSYFTKSEVRNLTTNQTFDISEIKLDYKAEANEEITFSGKLYIPTIHQESYRVYIDDCLVEMKVDGESLDLAKYFETSEPCYSDIEMPTFQIRDLQPGEHLVEFKIKNNTGGVAFYMENNRKDTLYSLLFVLVTFSSIVFLVTVGSLILRNRKNLVFIIVFGLLAFSYLSITPWHERTHDVHGHLGFIKILQTGKYPAPQDCWECHQQPLYYLISSSIESAFKFVGIEGFNQDNFILQVSNLLFFGIFLLFGMGILEQIFDKNKLSVKFTFLMMLLLVTWPSGILHSIRIGNDSLLYMLIAASIYFLYRWINSCNIKVLVYSCILACFAMLTKVTGIILVPVIFLTVIIKIEVIQKIVGKLREKSSISLLDIFRFIDKHILRNLIIFLIVSLACTFGPTLLMTQGKEITHMNEPGNENFKMERDLKYFIYFDIKEYLTTPTFHTWDDCCGRNNFWVAIPKSSLFGEFGINNKDNKFIMTKIINLVSFIILIITVINFLKLIKSKDNQSIQIYLPILMLGFFLLASVIFFRWRYPYYSNQDFRYMYPFIISWIAVLGYNESKVKAFVFISMILAVVIFFLDAVIANKY